MRGGATEIKDERDTGSESPRRGFRRHITYANVTATLALVLATSMGGAYAAPLITGSQIAKETLTSANFKNESVTSNDLALDSIGSTRVKDGSMLFKDAKSGQFGPGLLSTHGFLFGDQALGVSSVAIAGTDPVEGQAASFVGYGPLPVLPSGGLVTAVVGFTATASGSGTWTCSVYRDTPGNFKIRDFSSTTTSMNETTTVTWGTSSQQSYTVDFRVLCIGAGRTITEAELNVVAGYRPLG